MIHAQADDTAVQLLAYVSFYILGAKVRSRALLFLYKLFFQLVYHVFYRNLVRFVDLLSIQGYLS